MSGRNSTAKKLRLARERHIMSERSVDVRRSIIAWCEAPKRAIFDDDGKAVSDSRKYVEVAKRELVDAADADRPGKDGLHVTMADGSEWLVTVERRR